MKLELIKEELEIDSDISALNKNFRNYLELVFNPIFLSKLDRVFKEPLVIKNFKEKTNVMAVTVGDKISINIQMFDSLPLDNAMMYVIHELFHVLQNKSQFSNIRRINKKLKEATLKKISVNNINEFLTGKKQNIHSDYKDEFLSYCSNSAFDWKMCPELKEEYKKILTDSGVFNMKSVWWKKRF